MNNTLPILASDAGLAAYLNQINTFPMLTQHEEYELAKRWSDMADLEAAHTLVTSHLRLVSKIALKYRGYGLPMSDIIAEGNIGLMHAVKKFQPDLGYRLSTYAMWWIKAAIQDYILKTWSIVKIGTSSMQKSLFFNLRKIKNKLLAMDGTNSIEGNIGEISKSLNASEQDVRDMDARLNRGDQSLNAQAFGEDDSSEFIESIASQDPCYEAEMIEKSEFTRKQELLTSAMSELQDRERSIVQKMLLQENAMTLEELSQEYGISRERVRQIRERALQKIKQFVLKHSSL